jgi:hypothetical protein
MSSESDNSHNLNILGSISSPKILDYTFSYSKKKKKRYIGIHFQIQNSSVLFIHILHDNEVIWAKHSIAFSSLAISISVHVGAYF